MLMALTISELTPQILAFYARSYVKNVFGKSANKIPEKQLDGATSLGCMP